MMKGKLKRKLVDLANTFAEDDLAGVGEGLGGAHDGAVRLKEVEEAQAANVRTFGAREGGGVPEFLAQATRSGSRRSVIF